MDKKFEKMLHEAERVREYARNTGDVAPHAEHIARMVEYGEERGLLQGSVLEGTASEEKLNLSTEWAAGVLEVGHGESVGPVLSKSDNEKVEINRRAERAATAFIQEVAARDNVAFDHDPWFSR
jgi:hypothetical protein